MQFCHDQLHFCPTTLDLRGEKQVGVANIKPTRASITADALSIATWPLGQEAPILTFMLFCIKAATADAVSAPTNILTQVTKYSVEFLAKFFTTGFSSFVRRLNPIFGSIFGHEGVAEECGEYIVALTNLAAAGITHSRGSLKL